MNRELMAKLHELTTFLAELSGSVELGLERATMLLAWESSPQLRHELLGKLEWVRKPGVRERVGAVLKVSDLRALREDYVGELYRKHQKALPRPLEVKECSSRELIDICGRWRAEHADPPMTVLDEECSTGRRILALSTRWPDATFYGVTKDVRAARVALINCQLNQVQAFIMHASPEVHELRLETAAGRANWGLANSWESHWAELKLRVKKQSARNTAAPRAPHQKSATDAHRQVARK